MSDIAMLVAEEYERRTKNLKKVEGEMTLVSSSLLLGLTERLVKDKRVFPKWVLKWEPKTQFAIAASNSFFSA
ncbi:hypothetical protein HN51_031064 [Arachis hypogaea]